MTVREIADPRDIGMMAADAIAKGCGHTAELILPARRGELALLILQPTTPAPMKWLRRVAQPALAVIGDDPGDAGLGPKAWLATRRLAEWAAFGVVHASGGTVDDYKTIVALAKIHRRLLLVECTSARAAEWAAVLLRRKPRPLPLLGFLPRDGVHPVAPSRETMQ